VSVCVCVCARVCACACLRACCECMQRACAFACACVVSERSMRVRVRVRVCAFATASNRQQLDDVGQGNAWYHALEFVGLCPANHVGGAPILGVDLLPRIRVDCCSSRESHRKDDGKPCHCALPS
jgi:hypothetical protein